MGIHEDIINYLKLIDQKYLEAKRKGLSRFSIEWGTFSRDMNLEIRAKIEEGKKDIGDTEVMDRKWVVLFVCSR